MITKDFWRSLFWINAAVIGAWWWLGNWPAFGQGGYVSLIALGRLSGLLAAGAVLLQFTLMGRLPWLERSFGLDQLSRLHHTTGQLSLLFIVLHPALLVIGYSQLAGVGLVDQMKNFLFNYNSVWLATLGWLLFLAVVVISLTIVKNRLRYESWYFVHLLVYLALFTSFWHQIYIGPDLLSSRLFYGYWLTLYALVLGNHVIWRFGRPLHMLARHRFKVDRIVRESYNAVSIYIAGRELDKFAVAPGQFMIFRFLANKVWWQAHPFSLSMVPNGRELRITVKELGDFTRQLSLLPVGTSVMIDGPYGVFTEWMSVSPKVLLIAGGIGITPIRSLWENMLQKRRDAVLLYANKTRQDIVFGDELNSLSQKYQAKLVNVLSDDQDWPGEAGYLDEEKIRRLVPDVKSRDVYLCGPPPMTESLIRVLHGLGLPPAQIHYEKFSL